MDMTEETNRQNLAQKIVDREVNCLMSMVVSEFAGMYGSVSNDTVEQAFELASSIPSYEEAFEYEGYRVEEDNENDDFLIINSDDETVARIDSIMNTKEETIRQFCEREGIDPREHEVYEHWAVSNWLGKKLQAKGEKVDFDFCGLVVWARTTTGQSMILDDVIQSIAVKTFK